MHSTIHQSKVVTRHKYAINRGLFGYIIEFIAFAFAINQLNFIWKSLPYMDEGVPGKRTGTNMREKLTELKQRVLLWLRARLGGAGADGSEATDPSRRMLIAGGLAALAVAVAGVTLSTPAEAHHGRRRSRRWRRRRRRRHRRWRSRRWRHRRWRSRRRRYYRRRGPSFILVL